MTLCLHYSTYALCTLQPLKKSFVCKPAPLIILIVHCLNFGDSEMTCMRSRSRRAVMLMIMLKDGIFSSNKKFATLLHVSCISRRRLTNVPNREMRNISHQAFMRTIKELSKARQAFKAENVRQFSHPRLGCHKMLKIFFYDICSCFFRHKCRIRFYFDDLLVQ